MASRRSKNTRDVLIDTALELFAKDGFRGTTIRAIEQAAGLSPGAGGLYRHFRSKDDLLVAAVRRYRDEVSAFAARTPELLDLGDVRAELRLTEKLCRKFNERNHALLRVLHLERRGIPPSARGTFESAWDDAYRMYASWLERRLGPQTKVDVEAAAIQLFGSLSQYQAQHDTFKKPPMGVTRERFVEAWVEHWTDFVMTHRGASAG